MFAPRSRGRTRGQLCVYRHGRAVVDLWTGQDPISGKPWDAECRGGTLERGHHALSVPVREYWLEFAVAEKYEVNELLSHRAGLSGFEPDSGIGGTELTDWSACVAALDRYALAAVDHRHCAVRSSRGLYPDHGPKYRGAHGEKWLKV
ncbi:hypothetical protein CRH09_36305 [Nocardia terpenica]|uniref:Beta-lactamase-related domain-containing protein n=2 Tax=Nocardia terpenica TaxID=455432 RepID=A0A291RTH0_9NOCA|nr:hypothetical protein CRH09_36305 [Nocardia terpenica]